VIGIPIATERIIMTNTTLNLDSARLECDRARISFVKAYSLYGKDSPQCRKAEANLAKAREELAASEWLLEE
jgi:hypothetical protein